MKIGHLINPKSISGTGFLSVIITILIIAPTIGIVWTFSEYRQKQADIATIKSRYIESRKTKLVTDINNILQFIEYKQSNTMDRLKNDISERVYNGYSLASHIYSFYKDSLSRDQIRFRIIETLRPIRWHNGTGYFFIIEHDGTVRLNGDRPDLENHNIIGFQDSNGQFITKDMIELAMNNDSGFYRYTFTKPGREGHDHVKLTHVKHFEPFNWVIGSGAYLDDMTASVQKEAITRIRQIKGDPNQYIFVIRNDGFCLSHPDEKFHRQNILDHTAPDGRKVIKELLAVAGSGTGGFLEYPWEKPETGQISNKLSYAVQVDKWDWTIGTGIYLDDIKETLSLEMSHFRNELIKNILIIFYVSAVLVVLSILFGLVITRRLYRGINAFTDFFKKAAVQDIKIDKDSLIFKEFQTLGELANQMVEDRGQKEKALEQAVRRAATLQDLLKNITDSMPSVLIAVDTDMKVIQWNRQASEMTGISSSDAEMKPVHQVFSLTGQQQALIQKALETRIPCMDSRVEQQAPDGTRYENITVYPLISNGIGGAVIRIDDITENVKIEEMMIQSEKMLSVGGLAAGMAHEINNPLSGIIGNADVLKNRLFNDLPVNVETARQSGTTFDVIRTYAHKRDLAPVLDNIKIAATRAATIVSDMLSFSRKSSSTFTAMDIARLMDKTIELAATNYDLKARFDFKQIKITRFYDDIPKIPCEASKLQQVFLNILTNGAQAMSSLKDNFGPEFTITIRQNQTHAIIEIRDNGPGMSKEVAKRIFEPFFTTKEIGVGTGLGLSVSYFIITDHHKGSLKVDSAPGKGAGFTIMLPITPPEK